MMIECEHIDYRIDDGTLVLSLNRPEKKNALTGDMYRTLTNALECAIAEDNIRVVLITAVGNYFCAGNDVHSFKAIADIPYRERPGFNFMNTLANFPKPLVAALPGDAIGIGVTMLLHCDLVYLCRNCQLQLPFVNIGLVPEFGSTKLLQERIGYQRAVELLFLRQRLDADEALAMGLVNAILPSSDVFTTAMATCSALTRHSSAVLQHTKRLMKQSQSPAIADKIEQETLAINELLASMKLPGDNSHN